MQGGVEHSHVELRRLFDIGHDYIQVIKARRVEWQQFGLRHCQRRQRQPEQGQGSEQIAAGGVHGVSFWLAAGLTAGSAAD